MGLTPHVRGENIALRAYKNYPSLSTIHHQFKLKKKKKIVLPLMHRLAESNVVGYGDGFQWWWMGFNGVGGLVSMVVWMLF